VQLNWGTPVPTVMPNSHTPIRRCPCMQLNWGMLIATLPVLGSTTVYGSTVLDYSDTVQRIASSSVSHRPARAF
jgi:hypothetical protein